MKEKNCKNKNIVNLVIEREERMHLLSGLVVSSTRPPLLVRAEQQNRQHLVSFTNTLSSEAGNLSSSLQGSAVVSSTRPTVLVRVGQQNGQHPAWLLQGLALSGALLSSQTENCSCYIIPLSKNSDGMYRDVSAEFQIVTDISVFTKIFAGGGKKV